MAEEKGLNFLCSPFSIDAIELMLSIGCDRFKIGSGDTNNKELLYKIRDTGLPVLISTGMSDYDEIDYALNILSEKVNDITLFHCTTKYPTSPKDIILEEINVLKNKFKLPIGFSDHSGFIFPGIVASYLGITSIEVHTVLSKFSFGPDVSSSLDLDQLKDLVEGIRYIEKMNQSNLKKLDVVKSLSDTKSLFGRSFFLSKEIKKGEIILKEHLKYLKPGNGLNYDQLDNILGKKTKSDLEKNHMITYADLEN
jgi:Sialic acid synthase